MHKLHFGVDIKMWPSDCKWSDLHRIAITTVMSTHKQNSNMSQ